MNSHIQYTHLVILPHSTLGCANAIPEFVAEVTSCGPGRPRIRETPLGRFSFRYLKPQLRGGYRLIDLGGGQRAFVASPEKAFLDLVHLQPGGDDPARIDGLRLTSTRFPCGDWYGSRPPREDRS